MYLTVNLYTYISVVMGRQVEDRDNIDINNASTTRQIIENLKPDNKYRIKVQARTGAGPGQEEFAEINTRPKGSK